MPKISDLSQYPGQVIGEDFFPLVQSSSLTTYRASVSDLIVNISTGSFSGSLTGELIGNVTGSLTGNVIGFSSTSSIAISAESLQYPNSSR